MSYWIDQKYVQLLSPRLERFNRKGPSLWSFRCPLCGDSQKNHSKTRGFVYTKEGDLWFHCHNCTRTMRFENFLKTIDYRLWTEYKTEFFKAHEGESGVTAPTVRTYDDDNAIRVLQSLPTIESLRNDHPAKLYLQSRLIPERFFKVFRYTDKFKLFTNQLLPGKFENLEKERIAIVVPYFDRNHHFYAFVGRSLIPDDTLRYIAINLNNNKPMIFGIDQVNFNQDVFVLEGQFDSCFVENAVSVTGSSFERVALEIPINRVVVVPDNEPYSPQIKKRIQHCIDQGFRVVFWPDYIKEKDVNDMVKSGLTSENIMTILKANIFEGLKAKIRLGHWSKV